jgi:DNA-binding MurR/RpiR family transcriptional regulator
VVKNYAEMRNYLIKENMKMMSQAREVKGKRVSLYTTKDDASNTLKIVVEDGQKMSEVNIIMDKVNIQDKIHFHKQVSYVLYSDLLSSFLNKSQLENKVSKLEDQIKREKTIYKGWKNQIEKLEADLVVVGGNSGEKKLAMKLLENKDKTIQ